MQALAFDLGGTHLRSGVVDDAGNLRRVSKCRIRDRSDHHSQERIWDVIIATIVSYHRANSKVLSSEAPIVIAVPGPVERNKRLLQAPTVSGPGDVPDLVSQLEKMTGRTVYLINDISAAAWFFGTRTVAKRFLVVTVSSGIGSKVFDRSHPLRVLDDPPHSGEIGHFVVDDDEAAPLCDCGGKGHLGAIASGRGVEHAVRTRARSDPCGFLASVIGSTCIDREMLTNESHIVPAALAGDRWTWRVIEDCTRPLIRTLMTVALAAGLDRIFVIGGFAQALGPPYERMLRCLFASMGHYRLLQENLEELVALESVTEEVCLEGCSAFLRMRGTRTWS